MRRGPLDGTEDVHEGVLKRPPTRYESVNLQVGGNVH